MVMETWFKMNKVHKVHTKLASGDYFELLRAHQEANAELHKNFLRNRLQGLQKAAGSILTPATSRWLQQLSVHVKHTL